MKHYTDLACEITPSGYKADVNELEFGCKSECVKIDSSKKATCYGKPFGEYYTLSCENLFYLSPIISNYLSQQLSKYLQEKIKQLTHKKNNKILIACLGNDNYICDSLGAKVFDSLVVGKNYFTQNTLYAISPNVQAKTNIKSVDYVLAVVKKIKPDLCIIVDSLCAHNITKLASCVQVCDSGVLAGGAVNRENAVLLSKKTIGIPTLCIGVPLCVRIESIFNDFFNELVTMQNFDEDDYYYKFKNVIVAPKNIDVLVNQSAELISKALNSALLGLSIKEQGILKF